MKDRPLWLRRFLLSISLLVWSIAAQTDPGRLELNKPIERDLKGGDSHAYLLEISEPRFVFLVAQQKGVDLVVTTFDPVGKKLLQLDSPNGPNGPENLWSIFEHPGIYRIEISSLSAEAKPGKYELKLVEMREIVADDGPFMSAKTLIKEILDLGNLREKENQKKAIEKLLPAAEFFRQIKEDKRRLAGLEQIGRVMASAGHLEKALAMFDDVVRSYVELGLKKEAIEAMKVAQGWAPNQLEFIDRNDKIRLLAGSVEDRRTEAYALREMALGFYNLGDYQRSIELTRRSLALALEIRDEGLTQGNYDNLGVLFTAVGDFARSLEAHQKALDLQLARRKQPTPGTILNIGNAYHGLGHFRLALERFETALTEFEKVKSPSGVAYAVSNIGSTYVEMGEWDKALEQFRRAQTLKAAFMPLDPASYCNISGILLAKGQPGEASEYALKAVELARKAGDNEALTRSLLLLSQSTLDQQLNSRSLEHAIEAISIAKLYGYPSLWKAHHHAALAELALGKTQDARRSLEASIAEIERLRPNLVGDEESIGRFFENTSAPFRTLSELEASNGRLEQALFYAEKVRARSMLDSIQAGRIEISRVLTEDEKQRESLARYALSLLNTQISRQSQPDKKVELQERLEKKRLEYEDLKTRLYAAHPALRTHRGEFSPIDLPGVFDLVGPGEVVVEFVANGDQIRAFVVGSATFGKPEIRSFLLDLNSTELREMVEAFRTDLAGGSLDFTTRSKGLFDRLLKPGIGQLEGKSNIIIVPDGPLWDLPFQALMDEKGKYLIEKAAVSYAPSLTALREMQKKAKARKPSPEAELLAFGNPTVGSSTKERVQRVFMSEKLEPIPEAERLVNELGKMYGPNRSKIFAGAAAREEVAKTESPKYRIVQFATHGILNNVSPMYSHLVLAQNDKNPNEDGLLEAWELKDLDLKADMVILSACETARGRIANGEGIIGMTWASFIAGAPTTVASQWKVESSSTTELMLEFHRQLLAKQRVSKAEALRRASLKLMKMPKYRHPSYWAGFVLVGDGS